MKKLKKKHKKFVKFHAKMPWLEPCSTMYLNMSQDVILCALSCRLLADVVMNFQASQEEVTLCVNPQKVSLKNYVEDEPGKRNILYIMGHFD
jgi:hypothetical protein